MRTQVTEATDLNASLNASINSEVAMLSNAQPRSRLVLVVDDEPLVAMLLQHHLTSAGHRVVCARDGAEAIAQIQIDEPDVVVLDTMMPVMGGVEVLQRLRAEGRLSTLKVIMLTAQSDEKHVVAALHLGAADYIAKPFSLEELIARIERLTPAHVH